MNNHIDYVEFLANDLEEIKSFYQNVFGWEFTDYGPEYTAFSNSGLQGGFARSDESVANGALIVLYHDDLESTMEKVLKMNGKVSKDIFSFPGGRRFHFIDPAGNELAVWSDK